MQDKVQKMSPEIRFKGYTDAWVLRKLGDIINVNSGRDYKHLNKGDIPVYGTGGYMLSVDKFLSDKNAVGIGRKGTINKPYVLYAPFWTVDTLFYTIPKTENDLFFISDIFQKINWLSKAESTGVPSLSKKTINNIKVYVPTFKEQQAIGLLLKKIDDLIALQQRKIDNLKMLKKALLQQLFPEKGKDIPRVRFTDFTNRWKQRKLNNLYKSVNEKNDLTLTKDRIISVAKMQWGKALIESTDKYMRTYNVMRIGDIAFEGNKSKFFKYGRLVENTIGDGLISHVFVVFRPLKKMNLSYWKYFIHDENIMHNVLRMSTTKATMMTNLVTKDFLKQQIFVPNKSEQQKIGELLDFLSSKIKLSEQELNNFEHSKKALLQKMFI
ncbi:restriction endonuclease subunit S [Pediococcus pentosaceus]|jgi:type I restriction enzyme S subunit